MTEIETGLFLYHKHRKGLTLFFKGKDSHPPTWKKPSPSDCGFWTNFNSSVFFSNYGRQKKKKIASVRYYKRAPDKLVDNVTN